MKTLADLHALRDKLKADIKLRKLKLLLVWVLVVLLPVLERL